MLDKAIEYGKEHCEPYRGAKACDKNCRNHGNCEWCKNNRMYRSNRLEEKIKFDLANKE